MRVWTSPLDAENTRRVEAYGWDARGALYHHVQHRRTEYMEEGDYALIELANGIVFAGVYIADGTGIDMTPLEEA